MFQNNKISNAQNNKISNAQNIIENAKNSTHLIEDKSDDEDDIISWDDVDTEDDQDNDNNEDSEELDDSDETIINDKDRGEKHISHPEITFDVVEKNNEKSVKISINLDLEETSKMVNIEFCISKEIFLKIAKQLNK
jgi:hypothetical protein